jgi:hypothetical protein
MPYETHSKELANISQQWWEYLEVEFDRMEAATNGVLLNRATAADFRAKYWGAPRLLECTARDAYKYASEELLAYWADRPRLTFCEFAYQSGCRAKFIVERAARAQSHRDDLALQADERLCAKRGTSRPRAETPWWSIRNLGKAA